MMRQRLPLILLVLLLQMGLSAAADLDERVVLNADNQHATEETWHGEGNVRISYQEIRIRCDAVDYDRASGDLLARGNVIVDRGPSRFTADELRFNLTTKTGVFTNATAQIDPMYSFTGNEIEKLDETHYRIDRATFTTCSTDGRPPWSFHVREALVEEEGLGRFRSVAMRVQGVPLFYLPYMVWPIKQERAAGLLFPRFGYSDRRGFNFGLPLYVPVGRSFDTTVFADYYTGGYFGLGNQWRWAPVQGAIGEINLYAIWVREPDEKTDSLQWKVNGRHEQDDFLGFRLLAQVENLSDIDFFQDFDRTFDANTRRSLYSFAYLTRTFGPYALNLRADHRQTFLTKTVVTYCEPGDPDDPCVPCEPGDPDNPCGPPVFTTETQPVVLSQLPEIEIRSGSTPVFGSQVYLNLISSVNAFYVDRGEDLKGTYGRADFFPQFSYTLPGAAWLSVTPRLGGRATYYTEQYSEDRKSFVDESLSRLYFTGAIDVVGPSFSRVFAGGIGKYQKVKHLVEPRFEYRYLTTPTDTLRIPIFDEVDSTPQDANRVRMVLANRLLGRGGEGIGTRELASFEIIQDYSFDAHLNSDDFGRTSQLGPLGMSLRLTPTVGTGFDARMSYDTLNKNLFSTSIAAAVQRPIGMLNLTWYQNYNPRNGDRISSQMRTLIGFRKTDFPLDFRIHLAYDIVNSVLSDQRYQINYKGSCWNVAAEYRDTKLGAFPTREFLVIFGLKGVGSLPQIRGNLGGY